MFEFCIKLIRKQYLILINAIILFSKNFKIVEIIHRCETTLRKRLAQLYIGWEKKVHYY